MTTLLEKAINELKNLPKRRQDTYAAIIFDELENEVLWGKLFSRTSDRKIKKMEIMVRDDLKKGARLHN